ncbi:MAG: NFACT RNA binding domain-containing protein [Gemmatimonadota bacterium]|nr:NFACT RNA binding domain-containing protein [Gemmatimonadota bacterium]
MDSLTLHYIARELNGWWSGRRVSAFRLDRQRRSIAMAAGPEHAATILLGSRAPTIVREESVRGRTPRTKSDEAGALSGYTITQVVAPEDDRRIIVVLDKAGKFRGSTSRSATLDVSLVPSARSARLVDDAGHVITSIGSAPAQSGEARPPLTAEDFVAAGEDSAGLVRGRWMSPWLARWLMRDPATAYERYQWISSLPDPQPSRCGALVLPFPFCDEPVPLASMLPPRVASETAAAPRNRVSRTIDRMREELARAGDAERLRLLADALMGFGDVIAPASVTLSDDSIVPTSATRDETAVQAAERLYREVRSMEKARETLPARIAALEKRGTAEPVTSRRAAPANERQQPAPARPYRTYRSSGGLAIWVGRGAKSNDDLTFHHASPNDVWLHARDSAGAHVVLRWHEDAPPPARDLEEAALLAAWHSRSRGSTVVPVDWTRRRYVRKPRGGAPGLVLLERSETIFARPSADVERALRSDR